MIILPIVEVMNRELRTQARTGFTYHLRVLGAGASLAACLFFGAQYGFSTRLGPALFSYLNTTLLITIWVFVPLLTADCISRERREGTLGLLFLTPLRAREIVMAKGMVHGIRALTLLLSVLPIVTISFLLGGVSWWEAIMSAGIKFGSVCWALAAGLLASSVSKPRSRALLLAGALAAVFFVGFVLLVGSSLLVSKGSPVGFKPSNPYQFQGWERRISLIQEILIMGFFGVTNPNGWRRFMYGAVARANQTAWLPQTAIVMLGSVLLLVAVILIAAWNLRRVWQEEPRSARSLRLEAMFCQPVVAVGFFRRWMRCKLEKNPIGWLEQRTWSGRLVTWGWLAVLVSFYSMFFYAPNSGRLLDEMQNFMAWCLLCLMAMSAAGSFQRERESRVLELLLVSPMSAGDLIWGRLRGLWGQFLLTFVLMLSVWIYFKGLFPRSLHPGMAIFFCSGYLTIPVIGLYFSLQRPNFFSSLLLTLFTALLLPYGVRFVAEVLNEILRRLYFVNLLQYADSPILMAVIQVGTALLLIGKLHRNLVERNFPFTEDAN